VPEREAMTPDTIFDLASITKPIATATSLVILAERGVIALDDPASKYVPELAKGGKGAITIRQILTHVAGLYSETKLSTFDHGRAGAMQAIFDMKARSAPGEKFLYSDIGFLVLEEVVRRASGQELDEFARANVFEPLGMRDTMFRPPRSLLPRIAPTEQRVARLGEDNAGELAIARGVVHDPRAWRLGGVAGNAGLFSTADDLARYARMILGEGTLDGARVLSPRAVAQMTARHDVPGGVRALGWDVRSPYSTSRGDALSMRAVGHGGYTGTSIWIDPAKDLFVIVLSNRVHPYGQGSVNPLAARIASIAGEAVASERPRAQTCPAEGEPVLAGIDVLRERGFDLLKGARVGLVTNATGRARDGATTISLLQDAPNVKLVALFAPEHGLGAAREGKIADATDEATGLPVYSLYGATLTPSSEALAGIDTLVFDIQDVGTRFYTYASTMHRAMRAAADVGLRFVLLDRPNPLGGDRVEGPMLLKAGNFVNHYALPVRHGLTMGELAQMIDADEHLGLALDVVPVRGWRRDMTYDETGLGFVSPSPNLRSVNEEMLYPGIGLLEGTNLSVGRGTDTPFELVGAPWIDGDALAAALAREPLAGVRFTATKFTPDASVYKGQECGGVSIAVTDRAQLEPVRIGLAIARVLAATSKEWHVGDLEKLVQSPAVVEAVKAGKPLAEIMAIASTDVGAWRAKREKYLLYPGVPCAAPPAETKLVAAR
jgi:uncharacterized protein YbbC (DUF1343 family)/CubicO group peptidase (beta-lactamase class C family)